MPRQRLRGDSVNVGLRCVGVQPGQCRSAPHGAVVDECGVMVG